MKGSKNYPLIWKREEDELFLKAYEKMNGAGATLGK
jgi:hypothetical protein